MPTVILLDVSLSMSRLASPSSDHGMRLIDVATSSTINFLQRLSEQSKLEYTALVVFSSLYEVKVKFTRDYEALKKACNNVTTYDKTLLDAAFQAVEMLVMEEWGPFSPVDLILITDGQTGVGEGSLKDAFKTFSRNEKRFPVPFSFPCHFNTICLSNDARDKVHFEKLIEMNNKKGDLYVPESLTVSGMAKCFDRILNTRYCKFETVLKCGHFQSGVLLFPPPLVTNSFSSINNLYKETSDAINFNKLKTGNSLNIIGFLDLQDFSHPSYFSRHLVTPIASEDDEHGESTGIITSIFSSSNRPKDIGFRPAFCVLLHGSLKTEKMGGVVQFSDDWYGMLHSYSDNKKRCSLMLSLFEPGSQSVPWLGNLKQLGAINETEGDASSKVEETPFPIAASSQRSYRSQSQAVWIKPSGLQSDLQKLLRYAKKLPEKQTTFFKEVNKVRRAGIIYGFHELLEALAATLEKEGESMSPEVNVQLRHVAEGLRHSPKRDLSKNIVAISFNRKKSDS